MTGGTADPSAVAACADVARCALLGRRAGVLDAIGRLDLDDDGHVRLLIRHQVSELALHALGTSPSDTTASRLRLRMEQVRQRPAAAPLALLEAFAEAQAALAAAQIPVLLLKGPVLAQRLWGGIERRPQHDVDVLVARTGIRRARRVLGGLGYAVRGRDQHALTLRRERVAIDLHWTLRSAPAYAIDERAAWAAAVPVEIGPLHARTLADEHLLALLGLSAAEDAALGMVKLKQLCDVWLLIRTIDASYDWDACLARRDAEGTTAAVVNGCWLALVTLAVEADAPRLHAAVRRRADAVHVHGRDQALALISAAPDDPIRDAWFDAFYPGSATLFRAHSFVAGFPGSVRDVRLSRYVPKARRGVRA